MTIYETIGLFAVIFLALIGVHRIVGWTVSGYQLEQKHMRLGRGCILISDDELAGRR